MITKGLAGLAITSAARTYSGRYYSPLLGYNLSQIQTLGMLWSFTGLGCPVESGHPSDFSLPWVRSYSSRSREDAAYSGDLKRWVDDCIDLIEGEHEPVSRRIALLDILNVRRVMGRYAGRGIDLFHEKPSEDWNEAARKIPPAFSRYMDRFTPHLEWGRSRRRRILDGSPAELDVELC